MAAMNTIAAPTGAPDTTTETPDTTTITAMMAATTASKAIERNDGGSPSGGRDDGNVMCSRMYNYQLCTFMAIDEEGKASWFSTRYSRRTVIGIRKRRWLICAS
jgi:hypothetical protein